MLIVLATILGLILPKIGAVPAGVRRTQTLNTINSAFHMAASIATSTGQPVMLILNLNDREIRVDRGGGSQQHRNVRNSGENQVSMFHDVESFSLPEGTKPDPYAVNSGSSEVEGQSEYRFYPNGEAIGPRMSILIPGNQRVTIDVDRLTGHPLVTEYEN